MLADLRQTPPASTVPTHLQESTWSGAVCAHGRRRMLSRSSSDSSPAQPQLPTALLPTKPLARGTAPTALLGAQTGLLPKRPRPRQPPSPAHTGPGPGPAALPARRSPAGPKAKAKAKASSRGPSPAAIGPCRARREADTSRAGPRSGRSCPVSYTHLTLPTILLV